MGNNTSGPSRSLVNSTRFAAIIALVVSLFGMTGSMLHVHIFPVIFSKEVVYHPIAAFALFLISLAMLLADAPRSRKLANLLSMGALLIATALAALQIIADSQWIGRLVANWEVISGGLQIPKVAVNSALFLIMAAASTYFYTLSGSPKSSYIALSLLGALVSAIGAAAIFGYLAELEVGYAWGFSYGMSLSEAIGAFVAGIGIICMFWSVALPALQSLRELLREITLFSTLLVLLVALCSGAFAVLPLYDQLQQLAKGEVSQLAERRADDILRYFSRINAEFPHQTDLLNAFQEPLGLIHALSASRLDDVDPGPSAVAMVLGAVRLDNSGARVAWLGREIPNEYLSLAPTATSKVSFYGPFQFSEAPVFIALKRKVNPIADRDLVDMLLVSGEFLGSVLTVREDDPSFVSLYLLERDEGTDRFFRFDRNVNQLVSFQTKSSRKINVGDQENMEDVAKGFLEPIPVSEHPSFLTYRGIPDTRYVVLAMGSGRDLYRSLNGRLVKSLALAIAFALFGALGTFRLVHKVVTQAEKIRQETNLARKSREELAKQSLREKEVLLQEIHHRVKNNLQVISSLLRLQARSSGSEELKNALRESENRIATIGVLHQLLYQSDNLAAVNLRTYIEQLCAGILKTFNAEKAVNFEFKGVDTEVELNVALPCGLLVTEILTNSVKHAFPEGKLGKVSASLGYLEPDMIELVLSDDGIGFEEAQIPVGKGALGSRLIKQLAEQLRATIERLQVQGTCYRILFPRSKAI